MKFSEISYGKWLELQEINHNYGKSTKISSKISTEVRVLIYERNLAKHRIKHKMVVILFFYIFVFSHH